MPPVTNNRKGPSVSQYVANLNTIPGPNEPLTATGSELEWNENDLASFTNTEFLDLETPDLGDLLDGNNNTNNRSETVASGNTSSGEDHTVSNKRQKTNQQGKIASPLNFMDENFHLDNIPSFLSSDPNNYSHQTFQSPLQTHFPPGAPPHTGAAQPYPPGTYTSPTAFPAPHHQNSYPPTPTHPIPPTGDPTDPSAASRLAAEEDKRRRNTAASARFRIKKKQREQALEQTAKELEGKVVGLEQRIGQLEAENDFLRELVTGKEKVSKERVKERWEEEKGKDGKKGEGKKSEKEGRVGGKRGVGTKAEKVVQEDEEADDSE